MPDQLPSDQYAAQHEFLNVIQQLPRQTEQTRRAELIRLRDDPRQRALLKGVNPSQRVAHYLNLAHANASQIATKTFQEAKAKAGYQKFGDEELRTLLEQKALRHQPSPQEQAVAEKAGGNATLDYIQHKMPAAVEAEHARLRGQLPLDGKPPDPAQLIDKMHGIDAAMLSGQTADMKRMNPQILSQAQQLQQQAQMAMSKGDSAGAQALGARAYSLISNENHRLLARDIVGGQAMTSADWDRLRDSAGKAAVSRHTGLDASEDGPVTSQSANVRQADLQGALGAPDAQKSLYDMGTNAFDQQFGKHKAFLVEDPPPPAMPLVAPKQRHPSPVVQQAPVVNQNDGMTFTGEPPASPQIAGGEQPIDAGISPTEDKNA